MTEHNDGDDWGDPNDFHVAPILGNDYCNTDSCCSSVHWGPPPECAYCHHPMPAGECECIGGVHSLAQAAEEIAKQVTIPRHLTPHATFGDDPSGWCGCAGCDPRDYCWCQSCREVYPPPITHTVKGIPMETMQQNPDGSWSPATPLPMQGWKARLEERLRRRGWKRLPNVLARWDERSL